jgi:hypothetical protein
MSNSLDITTIVDSIQTLACIALMINAAEIIAERQQYSSNGIYHYAVIKTSYTWMIKGWLAPVLDLLFGASCYITLVTLQFVLALLIVLHLFPSLSLPFVVVILLIQLLSHLRNHSSLDGSDQMQVILFASLVIFYLSPDPLVKQCSVLFISFQSLLSYFTAGFAKVRSAAWRNGAAIRDIMNTTSFGSKALALLLVQHSNLAKALCWAVIVFECALPLLVFGGIRSCFFFVAVGILFHLSAAIFMGLNSFFWSFVATYPALLFFASTFQSCIGALFKSLLHH